MTTPALAALERLESLGGSADVRDGRLRISVPMGLTDADRTALTVHRAGIVAELELRRRAAPAPEPVPSSDDDPTQDPRPDLAEDSALWTAFLRGAAELEGRVSYLVGDLRGFRAMGCRLAWAQNADGGSYLTMLPPVGVADAEWPRGSYGAARAHYLLPHAKQVTRMLRRAQGTDAARAMLDGVA